MEIVCLKDDYQVWMQFQDAEVLIRYLTADELLDISKKATKLVWRENRKVEERDIKELNKLLGRATVRGWKGITMNGEEYPYSLENCDFLMTKYFEFVEFVSEACMSLQSLAQAEKERKTKNSLLTSGQEGISRV